MRSSASSSASASATFSWYRQCWPTAAELLAGWALVRETAQRYDAKPFGVTDPEVSMRASCTKMFTTEMVGRVADRGVQIHGGSGYINEFPVERFYRDVRLLRLYEGTTQIQQLVIGKQLMKAE